MPNQAIQSLVRLMSLSIAICLSTTLVHGQAANNNNNNNNNNGNAGVAGIDIDADGVLRIRQSDPRLAVIQRQAAIQKRGPQAIKKSPMRKVSLQRLERSVQQSLAAGQGISTEQATLAGLTRAEYVFYLPGSHDIVIAGPAEEVIQNPDGRPVGLVTGRPTLRMDDLVVALRTFSKDRNKTDFISCSIDPTQEGLAAMQRYVNQLGGSITPNADVRNIALGMKEALGMQTVSIHGVPVNTRFAQTLVEADYRMKLIGIGLEVPAIPLQSWVARANPRSSASSLQRWFFMADYSSVKVSPDSTVLKLEGRGVKLVGEDERVDRAGNRIKTNNGGDSASKAFTRDFSEKFEKLADVTPVFFDMRNLFDLSVCAAFIHEQDFGGTANWDLGCFGDENRLQVEIANAPLQVETAVNAIWRGSRLMTPIGGGVHISARKLATNESIEQDSALNETQAKASAPDSLKADQWWWD